MIMPINESNNLEALKEALKYFYQKTKIKPTFEYIIFKNFNDEIQDAVELFAFCKAIPSKINIIEYNPIDDGVYQQADPEKPQKGHEGGNEASHRKLHGGHPQDSILGHDQDGHPPAGVQSHFRHWQR